MNDKIALFPSTTEVNAHGHLAVGGCDLVELAEAYGTPLYVFDEVTLRQACREYRLVFDRFYPNTTVQYASKAFLIGALVSLLKEEGLGLDVVSAGEMEIALAAGFPMDSVFFHGNNKSVEEIKLALSRHVGRIVVDNQDELRLLSRLADESARVVDILLRITPGVDAHTHGHLSTGISGSKFGFPLFAAEEAIAEALATPSLNLVGLHFHIGSLINEVQPYREAIDLVMELASDLRQRYGFMLEELDIGGGFGVRYTVTDRVPDTAYFAEGIAAGLRESCRKYRMPLPVLIIEPGRSIVARAGVAVYTIGTTKNVTGGRFLAVDGGMADNIRPAIYDARYEAMAAGKATENESEKVAVAGRYCESGDILIKEAWLPPLSAGERLAIPVCGAYCIPMASNYNAALKPPIVLVKEGKVHLVRRRQTFQDLVSCDLP